MDCRAVRDLLDLYEDGALDQGRAREVERHLETCGACRAELAALRAVRSRLLLLNDEPRTVDVVSPVLAAVGQRRSGPAALPRPLAAAAVAGLLLAAMLAYPPARTQAAEVVRGLFGVVTYMRAVVVSDDETPADEQGAPGASSCPLDQAACDFIEQLDSWVQAGDIDAVIASTEPGEYECPGPTPRGAGDVFPLCNGATPGERRQGYFVVALESEGEVNAAEHYRQRLRTWVLWEPPTRPVGITASPPRIVTLGCPEGTEPAACGDRFAVVFARELAPQQTGYTHSVLGFSVERTPGTGDFHLTNRLLEGPVSAAASPEFGRVLVEGGTLATPFLDDIRVFYPWSPDDASGGETSGRRESRTPGPAAGTPGPLVRVATGDDCLNVRAEPSLGAPVLECVAAGVLLQHHHETRQADGGTWLRVRTPAGAEGWASTAFLEP